MGNAQNSRELSLENSITIAELQNKKSPFKGSEIQTFENGSEIPISPLMYKIGSAIRRFGVATRADNMVGLLHTIIAGPEVDLEKRLEEISNFIFSWLEKHGASFQLQQVQTPSGTFFHEIYGYIFQEASFILFKMEYFRRKSDGCVGIDVKQLEGEGFVLGTFFSQLFSELRREGYTTLASIEDSLLDAETENEEEDFCYSSDEEEESTNPSENHFLELARSPKLISSWIEILRSKQRGYPDVLNTLLLFVHNCKSEANLALILEFIVPKWHDFVKIVLTRMLNSNNLPIVYSSCKLLYQLIAVSNVPLGWGDIGDLCTIFKHWSTIRAFSLHNPVSTCPDIQRDIVFIIFHCELPHEPIPPETQKLFQGLIDLNIPNDVRSSLNNFIQKLDIQT